MCGVIGYEPYDDDITISKRRIAAFHSLLGESKIRGMHAFGIAQKHVFRSFNFQEVVEQFDPTKSAIAHARYSTSGDWRDHKNNQPIEVNNMFLAFNGVIHMGTKEEYEEAFHVKCESDNDGEIFLRIIQESVDHELAAEEFIETLKGSFAGVWLVDNQVFAIRNPQRPLWRVSYLGAAWYASTRDIFRRAQFPEPGKVKPWIVE